MLERAADVLEETRRARDGLVAEGDAVLEEWEPEEGFRMLPSAALTRLAGRVRSPCPLLGEEGECRAHAWRPATCRLQGLPWREGTRGEVLPDGCRLEPGMASNPPQPLRFSALHALRHEADLDARAGAGERVPEGRTFVAEALERWGTRASRTAPRAPLHRPDPAPSRPPGAA